MIIAFEAQNAAANYDVPSTPQSTYGAALTMGIVRTAGAGTDTVVLYGSFDGTNFSAITGTQLSDGAAANSLSGDNDILRADVTGIPHLRISKTGTTDTFNVWYNYSIA